MSQNIDFGPKAYTANGTIAPYRIVMADPADQNVIQSTAAAALMLGVIDSVGADATTKTEANVQLFGIVEVEFGGAVNFGDIVTSDANGKAIAAVAGQHFIGQALQDAVDTEIGYMKIQRGELET